MRRNHARENWCYRGCGRRLSRRSLGWDRSRRCGSMRNEEGPAVDSRCGVLQIAWPGITWREKKIRVGEKGNLKMKTAIT